MLPVRKSGGPGKEVPPERARTKPEKKERSARGGMPEKNAETYLGQHETYPPAAAGKSMPMPPCVAGENTKAENLPYRPIRPVMRMRTGTLFSLLRQL
jgi:hypothetical protein